jgi:hypothetical protein
MIKDATHIERLYRSLRQIVVSRLAQASRIVGMALIFVFLLSALNACSLLTIESPVEPLPERDLNARMLTREFALVFGNAVAVEANRIFDQSDDDRTKLATLRWKINATTECLIAATQISPLVSMLDTWALTLQMRNFFDSEEVAAFLGVEHASVLGLSSTLEQQMRSLVRSLTTAEEFLDFENIVNAHARKFPFLDVSFNRVALINGGHWSPDDERFKLQTVGTAPEAMSDMADRMRLYGALIPESSRWQLQLMALESGLSSEDTIAAVHRIDAHMASFAAFTNASPEMLDKAMRDFRIAAVEASGNMESSALTVMQAFATERAAIISELTEQQKTLYAGIDQQRAALTVDLERISKEISAETWSNIHKLSKEIGFQITVFFVLMITLPFLAGLYVGQIRARLSK